MRRKLPCLSLSQKNWEKDVKNANKMMVTESQKYSQA